MKIKSALLTQGSGSIGGMTMAHNSGGIYLRARTIPTDPNTPAQSAVKAQFASLSANWSGVLTQAQRDDWTTYALNTPVVDKLGDPLVLTGQQMYIRCNTPRANAGVTILANAPSNFGLPEIGNVQFAGSEATQVLICVFDDTKPWTSLDDAYMFVQVSRPMSPAINFFRGPFRQLAAFAGDSTTPETSPANTGVSMFAFTQGQRLFIRCRVSDDEGRLSAPVIATALAVA